MGLADLLPSFRLPDRMRFELKASGLGMDEDRFSRALLGLVLVSFFASFASLLFVSGRYEVFGAVYSFFAAALLGSLVGYLFWNRPFSLSMVREKEIDAGLVFAARELSVSLRAGAGLPDALREVSPPGYLGEFFERARVRLAGGEPENSVFGHLSKSTGSRYLQRLFAILMIEGGNLVPSLEQYIDEVKRAQSRRMLEYEMRSQLFSRLLPLLFVGSASIILVFSIAGFHFSAHLPLSSVIFLNFIALPFALVFFIQSLKAASPVV